MVAVTAGELSPVPTGIVYCGAIEGCHEAYELAPSTGVDRGAHRLV